MKIETYHMPTACIYICNHSIHQFTTTEKCSNEALVQAKYGQNLSKICSSCYADDSKPAPKPSRGALESQSLFRTRARVTKPEGSIAHAIVLSCCNVNFDAILIALERREGLNQTLCSIINTLTVGQCQTCRIRICQIKWQGNVVVLAIFEKSTSFQYLFFGIQHR